MSRSRELDELARPRAGIVTRRELLRLGWSASAIDRARGQGLLLDLARGVYRTAGAPFDRRAACFAAVAIAGHQSALARYSAAEVHGMTEPRPGPVEVLLPHGCRVPRGNDRLVRVTRTRLLPDAERCVRKGLPVTTVARTLLDLAARTSAGRLTELTAAGLRIRGCNLADLEAVLAAHPAARGRDRLRAAIAVLGEDGGAARSDAEIRALDVVVAAGLPRPVVAHRIFGDDGTFIAEVDLAYPQQRIAIEIDGYRWHSSPARKRADEERQNRLVVAGWTVLRFSATDVRRRPGHVVEVIRRALGAVSTGR